MNPSRLMLQSTPQEVADLSGQVTHPIHEYDEARIAKLLAAWQLAAGFVRLQHGSELRIGGRNWQVVMGNGHSPEHACLYSAEDGLLISGDQVLPRIGR